jgi:hypothetical protein
MPTNIYGNGFRNTIVTTGEDLLLKPGNYDMHVL